MSHPKWRGLSHRHTARSAAEATAGQQQLHLRSFAAALFSSLCLMSCFAAAAQAAPQPQPAAGPVLANKEITNAPTARRSAVSVTAPCGFNIAGTTAYYNHCGPTWVCIRVRKRMSFDYNRMVPPWTNTILGSTGSISWAWYIQPNCWP
jgi:hypothetical protein